MSNHRTVSRSAVEGDSPEVAPKTDGADGSEIAPSVALEASVPTDPDDEQAELNRAIKAEQEAYQAGEQARQLSVVTQAKRSGGDVDHGKANMIGESAAEKARIKALKGREPGVYVTSTIKVRGKDGPVFAPPGYRLTSFMVKELGEKQIAELEQQELVADYRR